MFENNSNNQAEIEDIFAKTDSADNVASTMSQKSVTARQDLIRSVSSGPYKKIIKVIIIILIIFIVIGIFYFVLPRLIGKINFNWLKSKPQSNQEIVQPINNSSIESNSSTTINQTAEPDADQDGLSDQEEQTLGTDPNQVDSDQDGLFDRDEVRVYKTNPLAPDTDGDNLSDGQEVRQGLDPKNPTPGARLINLE